MRKLVLLLVVGVAALATAVVATAADYRGDGGPEVAPSFVAGHVSNECEGGQKVEVAGGDLVSGYYNLSFEGFAGWIQLFVNNTSSGKTFDFRTDAPNAHFVTSIYVKGGPFGSNLYNYAGAGINDVGADNGLHSPLNANNGKWYGLSHICVFTDKK